MVGAFGLYSDKAYKHTCLGRTSVGERSSKFGSPCSYNRRCRCVVGVAVDSTRTPPPLPSDEYEYTYRIPCQYATLVPKTKISAEQLCRAILLLPLPKTLATASLPEYVATHYHQTDYLAPFRTRHFTQTGLHTLAPRHHAEA